MEEGLTAEEILKTLESNILKKLNIENLEKDFDKIDPDSLDNLNIKELQHLYKILKGKENELVTKNSNIYNKLIKKISDRLIILNIKRGGEEMKKKKELSPESTREEKDKELESSKPTHEVQKKVEKELEESVESGNISEKTAMGIMTYIRKFWKYLTVDIKEFTEGTEELRKELGEFSAILQNDKFANALKYLGELGPTIITGIKKEGLNPNQLQRRLIKRGLSNLTAAIVSIITISLAVSVAVTKTTYKYYYPEKYRQYKIFKKKHNL